MMKGHINTLPIIVFFAVIIMGGMAVFLYSSGNDINENLNHAEYNNFVNNIRNAVEEYAFSNNKGSSERFSLRLPQGVRKVCFVKRDETFEKFSDPHLDLKIDLESEKNVFFEPDLYPSTVLENFDLDYNPLCIEAKQGVVDVRLESVGNSTKILAENNAEDKKCMPLVYNGRVEDKIDVQFVGFGYDDETKFTNDANLYITNIFRQVEPFKSNSDKFNFYLNSKQYDNCELTYYIKCDNYGLQKHASVCPNDYIILLVDRSKMRDLASPIRSSAVMNLAKINTADEISVVAHEFGHSFGDLADEYVDDSYYSRFGLEADELKNCDSRGCATWQGMENTSCYRGCSLSDLYRATENSIMNNYYGDGGEVFGPVNEMVLREALGAYR